MQLKIKAINLSLSLLLICSKKTTPDNMKTNTLLLPVTGNVKNKNTQQSLWPAIMLQTTQSDALRLSCQWLHANPLCQQRQEDIQEAQKLPKHFSVDTDRYYSDICLLSFSNFAATRCNILIQIWQIALLATETKKTLSLK